MGLWECLTHSPDGPLVWWVWTGWGATELLGARVGKRGLYDMFHCPFNGAQLRT